MLLTFFVPVLIYTIARIIMFFFLYVSGYKKKLIGYSALLSLIDVLFLLIVFAFIKKTIFIDWDANISPLHVSIVVVFFLFTGLTASLLSKMFNAELKEEDSLVEDGLANTVAGIIASLIIFQSQQKPTVESSAQVYSLEAFKDIIREIIMSESAKSRFVQKVKEYLLIQKNRYDKKKLTLSRFDIILSHELTDGASSLRLKVDYKQKSQLMMNNSISIIISGDTLLVVLQS